MTEKINILFCIVTAIIVTIINIIEGVTLLDGSVRTITTIIITFIVTSGAKLYLDHKVFVKEVKEEEDENIEPNKEIKDIESESLELEAEEMEMEIINSDENIENN
jgi:hypothetical protein